MLTFCFVGASKLNHQTTHQQPAQPPSLQKPSILLNRTHISLHQAFIAMLSLLKCIVYMKFYVQADIQKDKTNTSKNKLSFASGLVASNPNSVRLVQKSLILVPWYNCYFVVAVVITQ